MLAAVGSAITVFIMVANALSPPNATQTAATASTPPAQVKEEYVSPNGFGPVYPGLIANEHKYSRHTILDVWPISDSGLFVVNLRTGISGRSYAKRLVDCRARMFAYYGLGETVGQMNVERPQGMTAAVRGSISDIISSEACEIAGMSWG